MTTITLPDTPSVSRVHRVNGHQVEIFALPTDVYRVECIDCGDKESVKVLSESTADPVGLVQRHCATRPPNWPEGLDWNGTGRWAVVTVVSGYSGNSWTVHPSVGVSRWETLEHATAHAAKRRAQGAAIAAAVVLDWGDDLQGDVMAIPRVGAALRRFFHLDDNGIHWWVVAIDLSHAKSILRALGGVHGRDERSIDEATDVVWSEMSADHVAKVRRCHRDGEAAPDVRPLSECEIGDAFCSEW